MMEQISINELWSVMHTLVVYTKLANYDNIRNRLMEVLNSDDKKRVFEATDGKRSVRDIESSTGVRKAAISEWWNEWQKEGIVEASEGVRGRRCRVLSLADFGIEVPSGKRQRVKRQKAANN